jgi:hypothetical protein
MAQKQLRTDLYQALKSFSIGSRIIHAGDTIVGGHPFMQGREKLFAPFRPTYGELPAPEPEAPVEAAPVRTPKVAAAPAAAPERTES